MIQTLKDFLNETKERQQVLDKYDPNTAMLDSDRRILMNFVADLTIVHFGLYPTQEEKIMVANATVSLFPNLKTEPSQFGGIVSIEIKQKISLHVKYF